VPPGVSQPSAGWRQNAAKEHHDVNTVTANLFRGCIVGQAIEYAPMVGVMLELLRDGVLFG